MRSDFRLGDWVVRPLHNCIERGAETVRIHPKPMAVLERLAEADGGVVTRDELFEAAWPGVIVTDDALTQSVVELRKAFGDSAHEAKVIKTVPKVGFCLVLPVSKLDAEPVAKGSRWTYFIAGMLALVVTVVALYLFVSTKEAMAPAPKSAEKSASIAVLPFVNMSSDPEQEYFSDGISEELISLLARIPELRVISSTSVFTFKDKAVEIPEVAEQLNVSHVLEGSVRKDGDKIRVTAQLVEAVTDTHLWSHSYDREFADIFAVQDDIARHVVDIIEITLLGAYPRSVPTDPEAYRLYLLGKSHLRKYGHTKALEYFQQVAELDPQYAEVHIAMASVYGGRTFLGEVSPREGYAKIGAEVALARQIDDKLPTLHRSVASKYFYFDWQWEAAEKGFQKAISLVPGYANTYQTYAWFLSAMGRPQEAEDMIDRALELEPLAPSMYLTASNVYYLSRRYEQALEQLQRVLELSPNHPLALCGIGWSYLQMGRLDEAVEIMEKSVELAPGILQNHWMLGHAYGIAGRTAEARQILHSLHSQTENRYVMPYAFAIIHTGLGETNMALDWLEKAYEDRNGWMVFLNVEPRLDPLRSEPRFRQLLERMAFPD